MGGKKGAPAGFPQSTMLSQNWLRGQSFPLFYNVFLSVLRQSPHICPARSGPEGPDRGPDGPQGPDGPEERRGAMGSQGEPRLDPRTAPPGPPDRTPGPDPPARSPTAHHLIAPIPTPAPLRNGPDGPDLPNQIKRPPAGHALFSEAWPWSCGHHSVGV